jgi:hypothetical protein
MRRRGLTGWWTAALAAVVLLGACSSGGSRGSGGAATVIERFKSRGLPVGSTYRFTAANDPNHLLGRPTGYVSKVAWTDTRIKRADVPDPERGSVDLGGSVEQFTSAAAAHHRMTYIKVVDSAAPGLAGVEYDYVVGDFLVRVSFLLPPAAAVAYARAAAG